MGLSHPPADLNTLPRKHEVITERRIVDRTVSEAFGVEFSNDFDSHPSWTNVADTARLLWLDSVSRHCDRAEPFSDGVERLTFKVSMDGSFIGKDKDFLSAGLVPLWDAKQSLQSLHTVFPLGLGWCGESEVTLNSIVPGLEDQIRDLNDNGFDVDASVFGFGHVHVSIDASGDMSTLWKFNGTGSAQAENTCLCCMGTKKSRQNIGDPSFDIMNESNRRTDLKPILSLPLLKIHPCTLHGHTRITERMLLLVARLSVRKEAVVKETAASLKRSKTQIGLALLD